MTVTTYRVEKQPNLPKLVAAVADALPDETPLGAPFETKDGGWAQAMVTESA
jgi:hypothetical protein